MIGGRRSFAGNGNGPGISGLSLQSNWRVTMHSIIYIVGLVVVVLIILSLFGLR
jgi:hypothetical protein